MADPVRDARVRSEIDTLRSVRDGIATLLPAQLIESMDELMLHEEPNEALLQMAWSIARDHIIVPPSVLEFIEQHVGNPAELPVDPTGRSGRLVARGGSDGATPPHL